MPDYTVTTKQTVMSTRCQAVLLSATGDDVDIFVNKETVSSVRVKSGATVPVKRSVILKIEAIAVNSSATLTVSIIDQ